MKEKFSGVESVLRASGLKKADLIGKSDPYCRVTWGREELGLMIFQIPQNKQYP